MSTVTRNYKIMLLAFSAIVVAVAAYKVLTFEAPTPEFYPLGFAAADVIAEFEGEGFRFEPTEPVYGREQTVGRSQDGRTFIQLLGGEDLVSVRIAANLNKGMPKSKLNEIRGNFYRMLDTLLPAWKQRRQWLEDKTLDIGNSGRRQTRVGPVEVTVRLNSRNSTWGLAFGNWTTIPPYDKGQWGTAEEGK